MRHRIRLVCGLAASLAAAACTPACTPHRAAATVTAQNLDNALALSASSATLADLAAAQSAAISRIRLLDARQQTAIALARLLSLPDADLATQIDSLRAILAGAPADQREAVMSALARREPALVDAAAGSPGFAIDRLQRDARAIDALHIQLESERDPALRAALLARRDAILEPFALIRAARRSAAADVAAINDLRAALDDQSRILRLNARALADLADPAAINTAAAADLYRSADLRALLLDSVERARGRSARDRVADWLSRTDSAIEIAIND